MCADKSKYSVFRRQLSGIYMWTIILTSDEICHTALSINARESALLAYFTARQYKLRNLKLLFVPPLGGGMEIIMKQIIKYMVFSVFTLCLFCIQFLRSGFFASCPMVEAKEKKTAYTYEAEKKELGSFKDIIADLKGMDLKIKPSDDNKCYISYKIYCYNRHDPFTIRVKDDVLRLDGRQIKPALHTSRKGKNTFQTTIANATLLLPSRIFSKLDLKTSTGSISLRKISCKTADLETAYGDVDAKRLTASEPVNIKTNAGNITLSSSRVSGRIKLKSIYGDVNAKKLDIRGSLYLTAKSGDIIASDLSVLGITGLKSSYGDIKMKKLRVSGGLNINADSGSIYMQDAFLSGKTKIRSEYGDVDLRLKNTCLDDLGIQAKVIDGNLTVGKVLGGNKKKAGDFGWIFTKPANRNAQIDIIVNCGDISIKAVS